jgi:hypothetical protein
MPMKKYNEVISSILKHIGITYAMDLADIMPQDDKRVKVGLWSIEPNGLDTHTKQFLSQVGSGLFKELNQKDGFDERTNVHRPIMKKRERPPSSIIKTSQATPIRNRNPTGNCNLTKAKCLLDSGADVSYISLDMVKALDANKYLISCINCFTCTGAGDTCHSIVGLINLTISYVNELSQRLTLKLSAHVIKELKYDLIIGRSTIKQHNLILQLPRHFLDLDALPRYWDLQAGRGCGRTVAAKLGTRTDDSGNTDIISVSEENANPLCGACSSLVIDASSSDCKTHSESAYPSCEVVSSRVNDASSSDRKTHG